MPAAAKTPEKKFKSIDEELRHHGHAASRGKSPIYADPKALTLIRDKAHPYWDPRVEDVVDENSSFYKDIAKNGVEVPVKVQRDGKNSDGSPRYLVWDGRQRVMTALAINANEGRTEETLIRVPFVVEDMEQGDVVMRSLALNIQRKGESPYSIAVKVSKALKLGKSLEELTEACGFTDTRILEKYLKLLNFHPEVQMAFHQGRLLVGNIVDFADVPFDQQVEVMAKVLDSGATKTHEVKATVQAVREGREVRLPEVKKTLGRAQLEKVGLVLGVLVEQKAPLIKPIEAGQSGGEAVDAAILAGAAAMLRVIQGDRAVLEQYPALKHAFNTALPTSAKS